MRVKGLTKKYGNLTVYDNFDLETEDGKITCILGESGSGKTTLLNCIARLTECGGELPLLRCAYVFQTPRLVPNLTVRGNLMLICDDGKAVDGMLERVSLTDKSGCFPVALSGGQAQRASLARAFLYGGDIILLDEPFNSLDLKLKKEISSLFLGLCKERRLTALVVTHDIDEALELADRVIVLSRGKIIYDKAVGEDTEGMRKELVAALLS